MKKGEICYALFVNVTSEFISFKISKGRYVGTTEEVKHDLHLDGYNIVFEDGFGSVDFMSAEDIFTSENEAMRGLVKMFQKKLQNCGVGDSRNEKA